ncbi:SHOCT domain-containing protein [bacterium]|nr:SHOCT domain-containing protein [bacterium]
MEVTLWILVGLLILALLATTVVRVVRRPQPEFKGSHAAEREADQPLYDRYDKDEVDEREYERRRRHLSEDRDVDRI